MIGKGAGRPWRGGRPHFELLGIFLCHDPIRISFDDNVDEYSPEVETVPPRLDEAEGVDALATVLHEEFDLWSSGEAGPSERYLPIAREIWERLQADAPTDDECAASWHLARAEELLAVHGRRVVDDQARVSQAVTANLAGFRPIPQWAVEAIDDFEAEAYAETSDLPTTPQRDFLDHLLALVRKVKAVG